MDGSLTKIEFRTAPRSLRLTDEEVAKLLAVTCTTVRKWSAGRAAPPRRMTEPIVWLVAGEQRKDGLRASGLPTCDWMIEPDDRQSSSDPDRA